MKAFQSYTPRVRRLIYDALITDIGCQEVSGADVFASKGFNRVCIFEHNSSSSIFNQSDKMSYCTGPTNTGVMPPWFTRWEAWISSTGIRVAKSSFFSPPANASGAPSSLFGTVKPLPSKVTIGFTSEAQMGIAIQADETSIQVKWFQGASGDYGTQKFPGFSPVLFGNSLLYVSSAPGENDLVLYYLRPALPRTVFARFEREDFAVEHAINSDLPIDLAKLVTSERKTGGTQELYGLDRLGRDVTLYSPAYTILTGREKATLSPSVSSGDYRRSALPVSIITGNNGTLSMAFASGSYSDVIVEPAVLSGDAEALTVAIESGFYE